MRVSYKWLKEYVNINVDPVELAEKLTMAGLAVEHVEYLGDGIKNVLVGEILEVKKHPQADKLVVCQVNVGKEVVQIVTGAPNVKPKQRVPVALVGAELPGLGELKKAELRGVESRGMMCSAAELNIDETLISEESKNGILILPPDTPIGEDIIKALYLDDTVLEFELTPNRSDCLSVLNIAREVGAIFQQKVVVPSVTLPEIGEEIENIASVEVIDPDLCSRYAARVVKGIKIGPSPLWMQHYLRCAGIRPINNVVDISNYVMLEMGQPLHTFDYDRLAGHKIVVRRADEGEKMITLDGQLRKFNSDTLLICDAEKPVAVAGVMGGLDTEVTKDTTNILIEAAHFHPVSIRHTSRLLGLRSEASLRFEKGIDVNAAIFAADRAAQLLADLAGGSVVKGYLDTFVEQHREVLIKLRTSRVNEILGTDLSTGFIASIMESLHFEVETNGEEMEVRIPSYRKDITREIDLIEEVARLNGYDKIPTTLPYGTTTEGKKTKFQEFEDRTRGLLQGMGLAEIITYSFISNSDLDKLSLSEDSLFKNVISIKNPLSDEQSIMRTTLVPGLLETAARNISRRNTSMAIYECGRVFYPDSGQLPKESLMLGALVTGTVRRGWNRQAQELDFYFLKGILTEMFQRLGIHNWTVKTGELPPFLHPGRSARVYLGDVPVGFLGEIHPKVQDNYDLETRSCIFEIEMAPVFDAAGEVFRYVPLARYPAVERDLAFLVKDTIPAGKVENIIWHWGGDILTAVNLFDFYKGAQIPEGYKSLAYSLVFQAKDRTLTDEEISHVVESIKQNLLEKLGVELR